MQNQTFPQEFTDLLNDPFFPTQLLKNDGESRLYEEFSTHPTQFARNILHASASSHSKWDTPEGREILQKFNLTKADIIRGSKK